MPCRGASPHPIPPTHGRYSTCLPERLAGRLAASQTDPELLNLSEEIALIDVRTEDLLGRVDSGESGHTWRELRTTYQTLQEATRSGDQRLDAALLADLGRLIDVGHGDSAAWADIHSLIEQRRRLAETERRRMYLLQHVLTADEAMMFVGAVTDVVQRHVRDRDTLTRISADLARLADHHG